MATERPFVNLLRGAASWRNFVLTLPGQERALDGATNYSRFRLGAAGRLRRMNDKCC